VRVIRPFAYTLTIQGIFIFSHWAFSTSSFSILVQWLIREIIPIRNSHNLKSMNLQLSRKKR
jgi:hypothetical protein